MNELFNRLRLKGFYKNPGLEPAVVDEVPSSMIPIIKPKRMPGEQLPTEASQPILGTEGFVPAQPTIPIKVFDRSKAESWVMGTEPPRQQLPIAPPTVEEKAAWQKAQDIYNNPPLEGNNFLNQVSRAALENPVVARTISITDPNIIAKEAERLDTIDKRYPDVKLPMRTTAETRAAAAKAAASPVASTRPAEAQTQPPVGLPVGGDITVTGINTSDRAGFSPRTYRDASGNVVTSGITGAIGRGGFVGAATDAEATRNLQSRFEQDKAASQMAANFDRQTEALRNARAEKLGISREVLDASEGRGVVKGTPVETAPNPFAIPGDNFGDDIRRRNELLGTINDPSVRKTDRAAALSTLQSFMSQPQPQPVRVQPQSQGNLLDANKFLLDQQKFAWQQGVDRNKAAIDELEAQSKVAGAKLQQQKYNDEQRQAFINDFSYPAEGAPQAQLGELAWNLSKSTGGQLSPQEATLYIQKVAEKNGVDWKDVQPESLVALGREAMKLAKQDRMQK